MDADRVENNYKRALTVYYRYYFEQDKKVVPSTPTGKYMPKYERVEGCYCFRWWRRISVAHQLENRHLCHKYHLDEQILRLVLWQTRYRVGLTRLVELAMSLHLGKQLGVDPDTVDLKEYYEKQEEEEAH